MSLCVCLSVRSRITEIIIHSTRNCRCMLRLTVAGSSLGASGYDLFPVCVLIVLEVLKAVVQSSSL